MNEKNRLPQRLVDLGEAMAPVLERLDAVFQERPVPTAPVVSIEEMLKTGLNTLTRSTGRLTDQVNALMTDVAAKEDVATRDVYRAVERFEGVLDEVILAYRDLNRQAPVGRALEPWDLLLRAYRHVLREIQDWLQDLVETLADPLSALRRKGLPTQGSVEIHLALTLTAPPELGALRRWCEEVARGMYSCQKERLGLLSTIGALALGWGIGDVLFGGDDVPAE